MKTQTTLAVSSTLPVLCPGGTVVCMATGPSLTQADVDYCRWKATVVVVNDAHKLAPWADVLYSSDRYWLKFHQAVPGFGGHRATIEYSPGRKALELARLAPEIVFYRNTGHHGMETAPDGMRRCGQDSGGGAVSGACQLGAKRMVLLGYGLGATNGKRHFFGDHPRGLSNTHNFPTWRQAFETMR